MEDSGIDSGDPNISTIAIVEEDHLFNTVRSDSSCESNSSPSLHSISKDVQPTVVISSLSGNASTRQMQKKLEARIEQAKRKHRLQEYKKNPPGLIPIERLPIPGTKEQQQPLVDYETDDSEEDIASFFPINRAKETHKHQELTDTFSIEEMSILSAGEEDDDDEEDDLQLVPPAPLRRKYYGCCFGDQSSNERCIIM